MTDLRDFLIIIGAICRMSAFLVGMMAVRHVMLKGMVVKEMPVKIRVLLYLTGCALGLSSVAALFRIAGIPFAPEMRELTHIGVSLSICMIGVLVMLCPTHEESLHCSRSSGFTLSISTNGGSQGQPSRIST